MSELRPEVTEQFAFTIMDRDYLGFQQNFRYWPMMWTGLGALLGAAIGWAALIALYTVITYFAHYTVPFMTLSWEVLIWVVYGLIVIAYILVYLPTRHARFQAVQEQKKLFSLMNRPVPTILKKLHFLPNYGRRRVQFSDLSAVVVMLFFPVFVSLGTNYSEGGQVWAFGLASFLSIFEVLTLGFYQAEFPPLPEARDSLVFIFQSYVRIAAGLIIIAGIQKVFRPLEGVYSCQGNVFRAGKFMLDTFGAKAFDDDEVYVGAFQLQDEDGHPVCAIMSGPQFRDALARAVKSAARDFVDSEMGAAAEVSLPAPAPAESAAPSPPPPTEAATPPEAPRPSSVLPELRPSTPSGTSSLPRLILPGSK